MFALNGYAEWPQKVFQAKFSQLAVVLQSERAGKYVSIQQSFVDWTVSRIGPFSSVLCGSFLCQTADNTFSCSQTQLAEPAKFCKILLIWLNICPKASSQSQISAILQGFHFHAGLSRQSFLFSAQMERVTFNVLFVRSFGFCFLFFCFTTRNIKC